MRIILFSLAAASLLPIAAFAQNDSGGDNTSDNAIHAVTAIHGDGTYTSTVSDPEAHTSEATTYNAANHIIEKVVYKLDDNNSPVSGLVYGKDNAVAFKTVYKHDDFNRISEEDDFTLTDLLLRRFVYVFGSDGKLSRVRAYDSEGNEMPESGARRDIPEPPNLHR